MFGEPSAAQRRGFFLCSTSGTIDGECSSSNFRSRSICVLRLSGCFGAGFSAARNFSPISLVMARLCLRSMSMRRGTTIPLERAYPSRSFSACEHGCPIKGTGDRRFWLSARALAFRTAGRLPRPLAIRDMRRITTGERRPRVLPKP
jgi:hypothetical protein